MNSASREVHRARSRKTGASVALKKIIMHHEKDGVGCAVTLLALLALSDLDQFSFQSQRYVRSSFSNYYRTRISSG
jgi:hypothetical protein